MNWHTFKYLDKRLDELSRYITFDKENKGIWSEALADLLILIGSAADTFFRDMGDCPNIQADHGYQKIYTQIQTKVQKRLKENQNIHDEIKKRWRIHHFRSIYEPYYELSQNEVIVPFGLRYYGKIRPFKRFKDNKNPVWWSAYNNLKHSFYDHLEEATLENVIGSLGALLILNTLHKHSKEYLAQYGILKQERGNTEPNLFAKALGMSKIGFPIKSPPFSLKSYIQTLNFRFDLRPDENVTNVFKELI